MTGILLPQVSVFKEERVEVVLSISNNIQMIDHFGLQILYSIFCRNNYHIRMIEEFEMMK
jgi:hypothetical protein